jgi:hypothetical protein
MVYCNLCTENVSKRLITGPPLIVSTRSQSDPNEGRYKLLPISVDNILFLNPKISKIWSL